jgi:hypothetical protein
MEDTVVSVVVDARFARRLPDPVSENAARHILMVPVAEFPQSFPTEPNPRLPNINRALYRSILQSLTGEDGTAPGMFHVRHKGLTAIAESVTKIGNPDRYQIDFLPGQGLVDGGHSYAIIRRAQEQARVSGKPISDLQFVKLEVLTGVSLDFVDEIAQGLNASLQVKPYSLDNLAGRFEWIKESLADAGFVGKIAWRENEPQSVTALDVVSLLACMNIDKYPPAINASHPIQAYERKAAVLKDFEQDSDDSGPRTYQKLAPIAAQILELYDRICKEAEELWRPGHPGSQFGAWSFVDYRPTRPHIFPFLPDGENTSPYKLYAGAAYPIFAAFRRLVEEDPQTKTFQWRGGFNAVLAFWREMAQELLTHTYNTSVEVGRSPDALGKSRGHWALIYSQVAMREMESRGLSAA